MKTSYFFVLSVLTFCACTSRQPDASLPTEDASEQQHVSVVVHRGANALAPENTMPSADSALVHGAEWIEVDVRTTADGVMYNLHDDELERTTDGVGRISESDAAYIETLDAGSWFSEQYKGLKVPTMRSMLQQLRASRAKVFFDIKPGTPIPAMVSLAREFCTPDSSFFWFAKEDMLREFLTLAPEMQVKVNAGDTLRLQYWIDLFAEYQLQPAIVEVNADNITSEFHDFCRRHNILIMVGAQGESLDDYQKAIDTGADLINLDKPELFERLLHPKEMSAVSIGVVGDGVTLNTSVLQQAIDSLSAEGGGRLILAPGRYLTGALQLKSHVELYLEEGAVLLGSTNPCDYDNLNGAEVGKRGDEDVHQGLLVSDGAKYVRICGKGEIDAQGLDLALAIDSLHHTGERIDPNYNTRRMRPSTRPKLFFMAHTDHIEVRGITVRNSAGWGLSFHNSTHILVENVKVVNRGFWNNDGIDINDCQQVTVRNCDVNAADDGICLKSDDPESFCDDVLIEKCRICSSASAVKFGTASYGGFRNVTIRDIEVYDTFRSAIALETVDGGTLENIEVDGIHAVNTGNPIFIRLGARHNAGRGVCRNITIRNIKAQVPFGRPDEAYDLRGPEVNYFHNPWPSSICGLPDQIVENVNLENIEIEYPGRATKGMAYVGLYRVKEVPENEAGYPEFSMFGELPSWAFYVRHVNNITFRNVKVSLADSDFRPAFVLDDVRNLTLETLTLPDGMTKESQIFQIE